MKEPQASPQPGGPAQAHQLLPLSSLGTVLIAGAIFCLIATLLFVRLASATLDNRYTTLDDQFIMSMRSLASPASDSIMRFFTTLGDPMVLTVFLGLAVVALWRIKRWIDAVGLVLSGAGGGILNQLLKALYERERPDLFPRIVEASGYSFPSGHAMGSMVCYAMLGFVIWRLLRSALDRSLLIVDIVLIILCVGLSRVYFGVHFPTDIIGGYIAGMLWVVICIILVRLAEWHVQRRQETVTRRG